MAKCGFPELEKDMQPNALLVPSMKCLQKHHKKLDTLLVNYIADDVKLSKTQTEYQPQSHAF